MRKIEATLFLSVLVLVLGSVHPASAATVTNIASTITNAPYPPALICTLVNSCVESYTVTGQGGVNQAETVPPQLSFSFGDSFNQVSNLSTGSNLGVSATCGLPGCQAWNFQDNILFSTNGSVVQAQASSTLTNVTNLQARIVQLIPNQNAVYTNTNANAKTLLGPTSAGLISVVDGWANFANPILGIDYTGTLPHPLAPGSYVLQIRGEAATGSSYAGTLTFTPVPLPSTIWLMLSGLLGMGLGLRRRGSSMLCKTPA